MKLCPNCAFSNDDCFPTCVWCNAVLVDVKSVPSEAPDDPEWEQRAIRKKRDALLRGQTRFATACYALAITLTSVMPGMVFSPLALLLWFAGAVLVATAMARGTVGQFSFALLQGAVSLALLYRFGTMHPLLPFMILGHVTLPMLFCCWIEWIHDAHR